MKRCGSIIRDVVAALRETPADRIAVLYAAPSRTPG